MYLTIYLLPCFYFTSIFSHYKDTVLINLAGFFYLTSSIGYIPQSGNDRSKVILCLLFLLCCVAWWAAIYGVAQSQTRLKWLSSSSSSSIFPRSHSSTCLSLEVQEGPFCPHHYQLSFISFANLMSGKLSHIMIFFLISPISQWVWYPFKYIL